MLSHEEMIGIQAERHELTNETEFESAEQYVLHLMHCSAYLHAARIVSGKSVLDLGCNTGYGAKMLSAHARKVVGVDVSERAIRMARQNYDDANVDFRVIDGIRLPFDDDSFDVVTCFQMIEHLVEYDSIMREVKRVLTPDGIAIFTTPNALLRLDPGMKPWNEFHVREFTSDELESVLAGYFEHICVLALYGREPLHQIVVSRADRIRRNARARTSDAAFKAKLRGARARLGALLPVWVSTRVTSSPSPAYNSPSLQFIQDHHGPEDFPYRQGDLNTALEFMAICSAADVAAGVESLADR